MSKNPLHPALADGKPHKMRSLYNYAFTVKGDFEKILKFAEENNLMDCVPEAPEPLITLSGLVHVTPFLSYEACDSLVETAEQLGKSHGWTPNEAEKQDYQIPELVLRDIDPQTHSFLADLGEVLKTYVGILYGVLPSKFGSIQFAKYTPTTTAGGNWHFDIQSDFSAVVALDDPESFEGGGTEFRSGLLQSFVLPPLPKGCASLFCGKTMLHRGLPVLSGQRRLLVYWMEI